MARLAEIIGIIVLALVFFGGVVWWMKPRRTERVLKPISNEEWNRIRDEFDAEFNARQRDTKVDE